MIQSSSTLCMVGVCIRVSNEIHNTYIRHTYTNRIYTRKKFINHRRRIRRGAQLGGGGGMFTLYFVVVVFIKRSIKKL